MTKKKPREYKAVIWTQDPTRPGQRASYWATNSEEARRLLVHEHGKDVVFSLHNEEDAKTPRYE